MDTDDLSKEAYSAVLEAAEKFHHDLTLQFGLLSWDCDNDDDFLSQSETLIKGWLGQGDLKYIIEGVFFDDPPGKPEFEKVLKSILKNISIVQQIPLENRIFD
jgi:hypothetical protein